MTFVERNIATYYKFNTLSLDISYFLLNTHTMYPLSSTRPTPF